jgi:hypothetical protein
MSTNKPTIALVEWHWMGHHPSYAVRFAHALAEAGMDVVPFCANPADFHKRLGSREASGGDHAGRIHSPHQIQRAPSRIKRPRRLQPVSQAINHFGILGKQLRQWCREHEGRIDQVFFCCIYDGDFAHFRYAERFFRFPWAGLYFNSRFFRMPGTLIPYQARLSCPEQFFGLPSCTGVAVVDPKAVPAIRERIGSEKKVVLFPDFTDIRLDSESTGQPGSLARKIRSFGQGKPVISLVGHLQRTKGLHSFTKAACDSSLEAITFFLGGEINWQEISEDDKRWFLQTWESRPNIYCHLQRLSSEVVLNQVIAESDIIYAAYNDFPNSSNILTKAALLKRPVVVSDGHLMAELVREFQLGEVVQDDDHTNVCQTLLTMLQPDYLEQLSTRARWQDYHNLQSAARLPEAFQQLFGNH